MVLNDYYILLLYLISTEGWRLESGFCYVHVTGISSIAGNVCRFMKCFSSHHAFGTQHTGQFPPFVAEMLLRLSVKWVADVL